MPHFIRLIWRDKILRASICDFFRDDFLHATGTFGQAFSFSRVSYGVSRAELIHRKPIRNDRFSREAEIAIFCEENAFKKVGQLR